MEDKAIQFEILKRNASVMIERLKSINLDVSRFELFLSDILEEKSPAFTNGSNGESMVAFVNDNIEYNYDEAISEMNELIEALKVYELYYQAKAFCKFTRTFINKKNKNADDFIVYRKGLIDIIEKLLRPNTMNYGEEREVVEDTFRTAYLFIKEEIEYFNNSELLEYLKKESTRVAFLDSEIREDLKKVNLADSRNTSLAEERDRIDANGIRSSYVNQRFITLLSLANLDDKKLKKKINKEIKNGEEAKIISQKAITDSNEIIGKLRIGKTEKEYFYKKTLQDFFIFITSASMLITFLTAGFGSARIFGRKYKTTISRYSISNGLTRRVEYGKFNDSTIIYEAYPYSEPVFSGNPYKRNVYAYDVSSLEMDSIEDVFELNLSEMDLKEQKQVEKKRYLSLDDDYDDVIRYVERIEVDKTEYKGGFATGYLIAFLIAAAAMDYLFIKEFQKKEEQLGIPLYISVRGLIKNIKQLKRIDNNTLEYENKLREIRSQTNDLLIQYKEYIKRLKVYYDFVKNNPEFIEEKEKIEDELKLARELNMD